MQSFPTLPFSVSMRQQHASGAKSAASALEPLHWQPFPCSVLGIVLGVGVVQSSVDDHS
jgi:hypothetical protein